MTRLPERLRLGPWGLSLYVSDQVGFGLRMNIKANILDRATGDAIDTHVVRVITVRKIQNDMDTIYSRCDCETF